ncbi:MAG: hypothetical protein PF904_10105 [Kiritimatiellae bacterium]|jgi:hypothetical protein|nr:hypothetical protein [Kiritimatiellia bacterium]
MKKSGKRFVSKRVIIYEIITFIFVIFIIWIDEINDVPNLMLGAEPTPANWQESLFESVIILLFGTAIIYMTVELFQKMKYLEGVLPVCASCKKIRDDKGAWQQVEEYVRDRSDAEFSHGICPECAKKLYPGLDLYDKDE